MFKPEGTSRVGRENQVYNASTGARLVAGCVVISETNQILLVQSTKHKDRWVLPKGGIEKDEADDYTKCAKRETWEEAGALGEITAALAPVSSFKKHSNTEYNCEFHFYEMGKNVQLADVYPESSARERRWFSLDDCLRELQHRPELLQIVKSSSVCAA